MDTKIYSIEINKEGSGFQDFRVGFKVGCEKKYVIKDIPNFVQAVERKQYVKYGKNLAFVHDIEKFDEHSKKIIHFMEKCIMMDREFLSGRYLYPLNSYEMTIHFTISCIQKTSGRNEILCWCNKGRRFALF